MMLYLAFPLFCIGAIPQVTARGSGAARVIFGLALYEVLLIAIGLTLGFMHRLTVQTYFLTTFCIAAFLLTQTVKNGISVDLSRVRRWVRTRRGGVALVLAGLMCVIGAIQIGYESLYGTRHFDGLWYHIPRMIFWSRQGSFDAWPTSSWGQIGLPVGADIVLGPKVFLGSGWGGIGFVTALLSLGAVACVYVVALDLGLTRWHGAMAALLFDSFPAIGQRFWTVNSDIAAAFPVLAAYVVLHRLKDGRIGLAVFLLLSAIAVACKPTIAPHVILLGGVALWQCRERIVAVRASVLPIIAAGAGALIIFASYWPVYQAFSDLLGGEGGRAHQVASLAEFREAVSLSALHWLLDPLGFALEAGLPVREFVASIYRLFGATFAALPDSWLPSPSQDVGRTGLAAVILLPLLLAGLPLQARGPVTALMLLGFISLSGVVHFQGWNSRYTIILLAGYALLWGGTRLFRHGQRRWILAGLVTANLGALAAVTVVVIYHDRIIYSQPGGYYDYISEQDQFTISRTLDGRPLLVLTSDSLDALLAGTRIAYPWNYVTCPPDGDWHRLLLQAANRSNWVAVSHQGREWLRPGLGFHRPGFPSCREVRVEMLNDALVTAGWRIFRRHHLVDLWNRQPLR